MYCQFDIFSAQMQDYAVLIVCLVVAAIVGFLVLSYFVSNNKIRGPLKMPATVFVTAVSVLFFLGIAGVILVVLRRAAKAA